MMTPTCHVCLNPGEERTRVRGFAIPCGTETADSPSVSIHQVIVGHALMAAAASS